MAAINKVRIRKQIVRAIEKLPTVIDLKRMVESGPEYDKTLEEYDVATFNAFLDRSKSSPTQRQDFTDPGANLQLVAQISMMSVWEDGYEIKAGDYFYIEGLKHLITYPKNNYDIYWDCDIEVVNAEVL